LVMLPAGVSTSCDAMVPAKPVWLDRTD
jgi:hypothetical protein